MRFQHNFPFDPRNGYNLQQLLAVQPPEEPADYTTFWQQTWQENAAIQLNPQLREIQGAPTFRIFEVNYTSLDNLRIGAWITLPRNQPIQRGLVIGHGYGGREGPAPELPVQNAAAIFPCARGFGRSRHPHLPDTAARHVLTGIESRDTYIHKGCVADYWNAASALLQLLPETKNRLDYLGASFGGGIGAMTLASDKRYSRAFLDVPAFGHFPLRAQGNNGEGWPCTGSWEAVRSYYRRHPQVLQTLAYFDSALAAKHITIPTMTACALFDPAVAPAGQFAVYNALAGPKHLFVRQAGHFPWPGEQQEQSTLNTQLEAWLSE
jgi:cephalosporin-C deacetylase